MWYQCKCVCLHPSAAGHLWRVGGAAGTSGPLMQPFWLLPNMGHKQSSPTDALFPLRVEWTVIMINKREAESEPVPKVNIYGSHSRQQSFHWLAKLLLWSKCQEGKVSLLKWSLRILMCIVMLRLCFIRDSCTKRKTHTEKPTCWICSVQLIQTFSMHMPVLEIGKEKKYSEHTVFCNIMWNIFFVEPFQEYLKHF